MKSSYLRAGVLACAVALSACGGSGDDVLVGGTIYGLTKEGLVLQINDGSDKIILPTDTTFYFEFKSDSAFEITVEKDPTNATCTVVSGGKGSTSTFNLTNVVVQCRTTPHPLKATVTGLGTSTDLILINGPDQRPVTPAPGEATVTVTFTEVAEESPYGVTVLKQPEGKFCSVTNGVGTMGAAKDGVNVAVTCASTAAAVTNSGV